MSQPFVINVADARILARERAATKIEFQGTDPADHFDDTGVNITVLQPGRPNGKYHAESGQEDFLVLHGECLLILEGEERRLKTWDYVHCPPGAKHIFVGLDEPCAVLMIGARREGETIVYPVNEVAAKYGASVTTETSDPAEAYADWPEPRVPVKLDWPL